MSSSTLTSPSKKSKCNGQLDVTEVYRRLAQRKYNGYGERVQEKREADEAEREHERRSMVILIAGLYFRTFCLHFFTSNRHRLCVPRFVTGCFHQILLLSRAKVWQLWQQIF